jgi:hypothetical protein
MHATSFTQLQVGPLGVIASAFSKLRSFRISVRTDQWDLNVGQAGLAIYSEDEIGSRRLGGCQGGGLRSCFGGFDVC